MSISTSWEIKIGTVAAPTDFTSRVMSMNIDQRVDVNVIGRGIARITLLNKDGALTPGGGGTYGSVDWFAQGVFINVITQANDGPFSTDVFDGIVTDFDLQDDGVYSTVTITAQDGLTVAGKTVGSTIGGGATFSYNTLYSALVDETGIVFPRLGQSNAKGSVAYEYGFTQPTVGSDDTVFPTTYADALQTYLIPSVNDVTWPTTATASGGFTNYGIISLGPTTTRSVANTVDFEFDPSDQVTASKLPFDADGFVQAFNNDTLITQADIATIFTGPPTEDTSIASTNSTYGNRTAAYTSTLAVSEFSNLADRLTNRYSTSRFDPVQIETSALLVKRVADNAAHSKWRMLLSIDTGIWQKLKVTWTGSGADEQTASCVIKGRTFNVTPADTILTLHLGNWADNHGFILDSDELDVDRLG